ncbi:MAG: hypothetical protein R3D28_20045, partial [Geminicoccaceae bacterium]
MATDGARAQRTVRGRSAGAGLRYLCRALALVLLAALAACSTGDGGGLGDDESQSGPRIAYDVRFEGSADSTLVGQLRAASAAAQETGRPPASLAILRNRARADVPRLEATLRSEGYYEGTVSFRIDEDPAPPTLATGVGMVDQALGAVATHVVFVVEPGPLYHFLHRRIDVIGEAFGYETPSLGKIGLREGEPARADAIIAAEAALLRNARVQGHPMARVGDRRLIIDPESRTMDVELAIEPGPVLHFATPVVSGQ